VPRPLPFGRAPWQAALLVLGGRGCVAKQRARGGAAGPAEVV